VIGLLRYVRGRSFFDAKWAGMAILREIWLLRFLQRLCDNDSIKSSAMRIEVKSVARGNGKEQIHYTFSAPFMLRHFPDTTVCGSCGL